MSEIMQPERYRAALYIRLSKEDEGAGESQSVVNQREFLLRYAAQEGLEVADIYVDDGFSGTSFQRPAFHRLLRDIDAGKVNMVITKDMSRLGRNYIETGNFIEIFCPEHDVRYIAVLDGVDTGRNSAANDISPFRAVMNDLYARETSKKIKTTKQNKQRQGLFIGGTAPYGYKLSKTMRNTLEIDPEASDVVRDIFRDVLSGLSCRQIAVQLNKRGVLPPGRYLGLKGKEGPYTGQWSAEAVAAIIKNQMYTGCMVQGKRRKVSYKSPKCIRVAQSDWIIVPDTHPAIISDKEFDRAQLLLESRRSVRERIYDHPLKGLVFCRECGHALGLINRPNARGEQTLYFICRTYQRFPKQNVCTGHSMKADRVLEEVKNALQHESVFHFNKETLNSIAQKCIHELNRKNKGREDSVFKLDKINKKIDAIYHDRLNDTLREEDFTRVYQQLLSEREALVRTYEHTADSECTPEILADEWINNFEKDGLRDIIVSLIERIDLSEEKELHILFRFRAKDDIIL